MGRLIDTSNIKVKPQYMQDVMGIAMIRCEDLSRILADVPTVEAIPKAEVKKFFEEGAKNVSNNVLAIVREDYIHKADYENRLKADMVVMLEEIKEQLREMHEDFFETEHFDEAYGVSNSMDIIQEKIEKLKGNKKH